MDAPVSNAVQGAYLIAAVVAGLIFGALALIFQEVADGLGCLLGGFCLAMWFLVLAPGGLIKSTSGRVALIAVFCILFFSLYFSHHTRNYGLIGCTAFAGAMVTILGIDCFSGAGLKEFWLYIWSEDNLLEMHRSLWTLTKRRSERGRVSDQHDYLPGHTRDPG